jgi:chemotaxis signal transduction protein
VNDAEAPSREEGEEELLPHYLIELAGELYALPRSADINLSWVQRPQEPTYLPTLPAWCLGLISERNIPVLLIDLRAVLGLSPRTGQESSDQTRHVFVERAGDTLGLLVDRTRRFRRLPRQPVTAAGEFISGMVHAEEGLIRILDLEAIWRFILLELGAPTPREAVA